MEIIVDSVDRTHITYQCENCSKYFFKNGNKRKHPKIVHHRHGSCGDLSNRTECRLSHCLKNPQEVKLIVTDATRKIEY